MMLSIPFLQALLWGAVTTLELALCACALGLALSVWYIFMQQLGFKKMIKCFNGFNLIVRALPELVTLFVIYFSLMAVVNLYLPFDIYIPPFLAGTIALGLTFSAYASPTIQGAFDAIPRAQVESARALGLNAWQVFKKVQIPQAFYYALPGLGNLWVTLLKDTAFVALIGLPEIMSRAQLAIATTKQPFNYYLIAALMYLVLTTTSQWGLNKLEEKYKLNV